MEDNNFLSKLSQNLLEILDDEEYYDITIEVEIFQTILRYIYGGNLSMEEYDTSDIIKILFAANELSLQELIKYLQSSLIKNNVNWIGQNFNMIYQMSFENNSFLELQKYCTDLITKESDKIFKSLDFSDISEKLIISLIQNDNLQISEVQVWENVIKWGLAQNPELSSDPASLSKDDFNVLKNTLQQCIPFIKFYNLTSKEFSDKVLPYKEILSEELFMDLLKTFLNLHPDSKPIDKLKHYNSNKLKYIDSKIITFQHIELISKWIDKLDIKDKLTSSYEFKLILRGSRDGLTSNKFHEICDNQSNTLTVIKVKGSDEILGGYNPVEWKFQDYKSSYNITKDSFIFSFENVDNIERHILSRVKDEKTAIFSVKYFGPLFGSNGDDLTTNGKSGYCKVKSYEKQIRKTTDNFSVEEYEVFQIIK
ncbi:carbohydrate-binding module family 13 protein [Rhizophagus irregularis DAOM 181602=DAOM 197198]|nr:carbohydrate-binding module family 13 protein [Rhizophagus irregularis DAOM 181602=DAOM 197198]